MTTGQAKVIFTAIGSFLSAALGILYVPVLLMVLSNIIDYATGLMAAPYRDGISSYKSMRGIFKKISMWLLVVVGVIIDNLITYCTSTLGFELKENFLVAAIVAVWIICNELISILENLVDIGVNVPKFLAPIVNNLKTTIEKSAGSEEDNGDNQDTESESN